MKIRFARRVSVVAAALLSIGMAGMSVLPSASATAKPSMKVNEPNFFGWSVNNAEPDFDYWSTGLTFHWAISNATAAICSETFTIEDYDAIGGPPDPVLGPDSETETFTVPKASRAYSMGLDVMDYDRGGLAYVVRATECNAAHTVITSNGVFATIQEVEDNDPAQTGAPAPTYSGAWTVSHCTCAGGGTTHFSTVKGASVSYRTVSPQDASGVTMAVVGAKGPTRGSFDVFVDGVKKATVNANATKVTNDTILYELIIPGLATHSVKLVNDGTAGHSRFDFDLAVNGA